MSPQAQPVQTRPRVEGDREAEILTATMEVLADVGYDRLTMDAVAQRAKASKATLYRRWNGKVSLVIDALHHHHQHDSPPVVVDTGSLRGDLIESFCGHGGLTDKPELDAFGAILTAVMRDPEFAAAFRAKYPRYKSVPYQVAESAAALIVFQRALEGAGTLDPQAVRDAIAGLDVMTFFGPIKFDARGVNSAKPMVVEQLQPDGKAYTVFPPAVAERAILYPMPPWNRRCSIPARCRWASICSRSGMSMATGRKPAVSPWWRPASSCWPAPAPPFCWGAFPGAPG